MKLIEFNGTYRHESSGDSQVVLVQFDGMLLHIWHVSDPFYRLFSSDVFQLNFSRFSGACRIKLPNGGRVETHDKDAFKQLQNTYHPMMGQLIGKRTLIQGVFALLLGLAIGVAAWVALRQ